MKNLKLCLQNGVRVNDEQLERLEEEKARLTRVVANITLEILVLEELLAKRSYEYRDC